MDIQKALSQLDPKNPEHWTADGSPRVDVVGKIIGSKSLKRQDITDVAPNFTRELAESPPAPPAPTQEIKTHEPREAVPDPDEGSGEATEEPISEQAYLDWALEVGPDELLANRDLFKEVGMILERNINENLRQMENMRLETEVLRRRHSDLLQFEINTDPDHNSQVEHIRRQGEIRAEKHARTRAVMEGHGGISPQDIQTALQTQSPIDRAMRARKAAPGSTRPARMPMRHAEE